MSANSELRGAYRTWLQARVREAELLEREAKAAGDNGLAFWCSVVMVEGGRQLAQKLRGVKPVDMMPVSLQAKGVQLPDLEEVERLRADNEAMRQRLRVVEAEGYTAKRNAAAAEGWGRYESECQRAKDLELEVARLRAELDGVAPWVDDRPAIWLG